MPRAVGPQA